MAVDNKKNQEQKTRKINFNTNKTALVKTAKKQMKGETEN